MPSVHRQAYHRILRSLKETPKLWRFSQHTATCGNIEVWLSNRYYATHFKYGSIHMGGASPFWFLFPCEWWRVRLIREIERAQAKTEFKDDSLLRGNR